MAHGSEKAEITAILPKRLATALRCKVQSTGNKSLNEHLRTNLTIPRALTEGRKPYLPCYFRRQKMSSGRRRGIFTTEAQRGTEKPLEG